MAGVSFNANCQKNKLDTICMPTKDFDANTVKAVKWKEQAAKAEQLKADTTDLRQLIRFKDQAFLALKKKADDNWADFDTLRSQQKKIIADQDKALREKDETIRKIGKPKHWCIGPVAGAGLSGTGFGAFVGVGISYGLTF
jgi:hypothetical protein